MQVLLKLKSWHRNDRVGPYQACDISWHNLQVDCGGLSFSLK